MNRGFWKLFASFRYVWLLPLLLAVALGAFFASKFLHSKRDHDHLARVPVAMILKSSENPFWKEVHEGAIAEARKWNIELAVDSTEDESQYEEQNRMVRTYLDRGARALIFAPNRQDRNLEVLQEANHRNIPVIIIDLPLTSEDLQRAKVTILSQIYSDNEKGGRLAARFLAANANGLSRVGLIAGRDPRNTYAHSREEGFVAELRKHPELRLTNESFADWSREKARDIARVWLKRKEAPDMIFAASDFMAFGVLDAIHDLKIPRPISIIGYDATRDGQSAVLEGKLLASIAQDPVEIGRRSVEFIARHFGGQDVPSVESVPVQIVYSARELKTSTGVD